MKPTKEQIEKARRVLLEGDAVAYHDDVCLGTEDIEAIKVLLTATAALRQDERPSDMAELARLVAKELRKRGIHATVTHSDWGNTVAVPKCDPLSCGNGLRWQWHPMSRSEFDNLTPSEIADVIQAEEARKAQEWAGDT